MFIQKLSEETNRIANPHYLVRLIKLLKYYKNSPSESGISHHILPKCKSWYPEYTKNKENIVKLTNREHFIIHNLYRKAFPKDNSMRVAFWNMSHLNKYTKLSSKEYETIRKEHSEWLKNNPNNPFRFLGKSGVENVSNRPEVKEKIKEKALIYWGKMTKEERSKENRRRHDYKKHSEWMKENNATKRPEVREKISKKLKGKEKPKHECKYCGKKCSILNILKWHGEKCKLRHV